MTDLATLGLRIESIEAELADNRLNKLEKSAMDTERATDALAMAARGLGASLNPVLASIDASVRELVELQRAQHAVAAVSDLVTSEVVQEAAAVQALTAEVQQASTAHMQFSASAKIAQTSMGGLSAETKQLASAMQQADSHVLAYRRSLENAGGTLAQQDAHMVAYRNHLKNISSGLKLTAQDGLNFSRQMADVGVQAAMGTNALMIAVMQGPQVFDILQQAALRSQMSIVASLRAMAAAAWGMIAPFAPMIAAVAGVALGIGALGLVIRATQKDVDGMNGELSEAVKKLSETSQEARAAQQAKDAFAASADGVRDAVRDMNAELAKAITTTRQSEVATLNAAKANQLKTLAVREQLQAELELRKTLAEAGLRTAQQGNTQGEMAALNLPQLQRDLEAAKTALDKNATDLVAAQQAIRNAAVPVAQRYAEEMSTASGRITRQYDQMRDAAVTAAVGNDQLTASLGDTLLTIEQQRQAAMDADKATGRTRKDSSGQNEYERLIEGAREYIAAQQIEREQMGMTAIERERAESYRRADEIATKGQTAASIALAAEIKREADALAGVRGEYEKAEAAKRSTEGLQGMLTQLERQAQLIGASSEAQALLNTEWAISDLQIKEMSPEMQLLIDRIRLLARGNEAARKEQDRYNDSLRLTLDLARQADDIMRDAASGFADAFGDAGKAIGGVLTSMTGLQSRLAEIAEQREEMSRLGILSAEREAMLERDRATATVGAYGDMISAARGYFKEGSDGYRILLAIEQAYRIQQMIGAIQAMTMGDQETGISLVNSARKAAAYGIEAVANAYRSIPYPFNIAAVAATVAGLAALGIKIAGGSGGGSAANDNHEATTANVRAVNGQQGQAQQQSVNSIAQAVRVEIGVNDDRFNAYVDGRATPIARNASAQMGRTVMDASKRAMPGIQNGQRRLGTT